jgi:hypothetical protein
MWPAHVQVKGLTAIGRLSELVSLLKTASAKPEIDQGGPLRVLGLLYVRAPAWPVGRLWDSLAPFGRVGECRQKILLSDILRMQFAEGKMALVPPMLRQ